MKRKLNFAMALLLSVAFAIGGCGGSDKKADTPKAAKTGGTINISLHQDPPKLDPNMSAAFVERHVFQSIFDKLVDLDSKGNIVPVLAEKWTISQDGKVYTLNLRKGVKFHDGTDFNAEAVKFNIERYKQQSSNRRAEVSCIKGIKIIDANTIELTLDKPYAPLLSMFADRAGMMCSPEAVKKLGDGFMNAPVGTGPYMFKSRVKGNTITLAKNPNYWKKGAPGADSLVYKTMPDPNVALVNLKSGQLDMTCRFPLNEAGNFANDKNITVSNNPGPGFAGIVLNVTHPKFKDKRIRQALEKALDRETIVKVAMFGVGTPGRTGLGPSSFAYVPELDKPTKPDIAAAKKLLAEAGAQNLKFTITTDVDPAAKQVCQVMQRQFKEIGVEMAIEQQDFGTVLDRAKKGNYEAATISWSGRMDPDGNLYQWLHTGAFNNYMKYSNPEVDKLLDDARVMTNIEDRKAAYKKIMTIVMDDAPYLYTYHENVVFGISKNLSGFTPNPDGMIRTVNMVKK